MAKQITAADAAKMIKDNATLMIGGFMSVGTPEVLMDALVARGVRGLTIISNDAGTPGTGISKLIEAGAVARMITTHIGLNPLAGQLMSEGKLDITLVPQGTLAEQIRAGGAGLGGVLTQTGLGTDVAVGKQIVQVDGADYLLERPLRADFALCRGSVADTDGNLLYKGTTRNFNPIMAMAADVVIAVACEIVAPGEIEPESIATPAIFVDYLVAGGEAQ